MNEAVLIGDTTSSPAMPDGLITGPSAWRAGDMGRDQVWRYDLSQAEIRELEDAMRATRGQPIIEIDQASFPLPNLSKRLLSWRDEVMHGCGFVQVCGLPVGEYSKEEAARIFFGVGVHLGSLRSQNAEGHVLGHVCNLEHDFHNNANLRGYRGGGPLKFHTDSVDIVALMCLQAAKEGGESWIASSIAVYNRIRETRPDLLAPLIAGFQYDLAGKGRTADEVTNSRVPVYSWHEGILSCRCLLYTSPSPRDRG